MSLVREALAKAEREAAAREAREAGLPAEVSRIPQPYRSRRSSRWPLAGGLAAAALAGAVLAAVLVRREAPAVSKPAPPSAGSATAAAKSPESSEKLPVKGEPAPPPVPDPATATTAPATTTTDIIADTGVAPALAVPRDSASEAPAQPSAPASAAPSAPAGTAAQSGRSAAAAPRSRSTAPTPAATPNGTYIREIPLGDGRAIQLGGIAWSSSAPLAYLNGRLVGLGEYVEGFRVAAIEPEAVRFDGGDSRPGVRFELRLR